MSRLSEAVLNELKRPDATVIETNYGIITPCDCGIGLQLSLSDLYIQADEVLMFTIHSTMMGTFIEANKGIIVEEDGKPIVQLVKKDPDHD